MISSQSSHSDKEITRLKARISGHFSHQVGLDADIWLTPMPDRKLTREEREEMLSTVVVEEDGKDVDPNVWTPAHAAVIKTAAKDPQVSRIFAG